MPASGTGGGSRFWTDSAAVWAPAHAGGLAVGPLAATYEKFVDMARLFGTDGVRGVANQDLTAELALGLGSAAARRLGNTLLARRRVAVVGRDPRASGEMLEAAVIAGLTS